MEGVIYMSAINAMNGVKGNMNVYPNYVYNNNKVSAQSLNKIQALPQDGTKAKVSYSSDLNQNPLKPGQTKNYNAVVESQLSESDRNAARLMDKSNASGMNQTDTAKAATSPKDPAQSTDKNITQVATALNQKAAPNADVMKIKTPAEKAVEELTQGPKPEAAKSASEKIAETTTKTAADAQAATSPAMDLDMNITQVATAMNQNAAPNANIMDPTQGANQSNQSAIPNVTL